MVNSLWCLLAAFGIFLMLRYLRYMTFLVAHVLILTICKKSRLYQLFIKPTCKYSCAS